MKKVVVRMYFMDDSFRACGIDPGTTADQLRQIIIEKLELKEDGCFALFEKKGEYERCIEADEKPVELMKSWEAESKTKPKEQPEPQFLFKKKIFLKEDDKELADLVARNLVYIQGLRNVNDGTYPCTVEEAIRLGSLQVQAVYGDHNPASHQIGFLTQNLKNFVPQPLWGNKKPGEWEAAILKEHPRHKGRSIDDAKLDYINLIKEWPFYGTTFFPPVKSPNNKNLPSKVVLGVNYDGIRLYKTKNRELISEHPFTEICSWASSSSTFAFEFGNHEASTKYSFETKQGAVIAATIQTYIDLLVQMLKNGEDEEEESQTGSSDGDE
jgi:hypothetical protein